MGWIDPAIVIIYLFVMVGVGLWCAKQSSKGMRSYFLGGNKVPWWVLAASGSASNYDVTGTMFLVSVFYVMGLKSFYLWWSWQFFASAFLLGYMALWVYRTKAMTAVELLHARFGDDRGGKLARSAGAVLMVAFLLFSIGYSFVGISKFLPTILPEGLPFHENGKVWAAAIMVMTMIYVTAGGFRGVVLTDMIQACLMSIGGLLVAYLAFSKLTPEAVAVVKEKFITGLGPVETIGSDTFGWHEFSKFLPYWICMGFLIHMNGAGGHYQEQRFLAARSERDVAKVGFGWGLFLVPRWLMIAGITFIAIAGLVEVDDPEKILPLVVHEMFPVGLRGLILAALAAAFMSTLSSVLNAASGMVVRDIVQPACPNMSEKKLIRIGYGVTVASLLIGFGIGSQADSISGIWSWMMAGLIGGMLVPNILRWHWWRFNGVGYSTGLFSALTVAAITGFGNYLEVPWLTLPEYISAPIIWVTSLIGSVVGSLLSKPTDMETLKKFYTNVRPFGCWGPVKAVLTPADLPEQVGPTKSIGLVITNVILGFCLMLGMYYGGFLCVGHLWSQAVPYLIMAVACAIALFFTWYKKVMELSDTPPETEE